MNDLSEKYKRVAEALKAMGTPKRLKLLVTMGAEGLSPIKIDGEIGWPRGTASRQLGYLRGCGLVAPFRDEQGMRYYVLTKDGRQVFDAIQSLIDDKEPA